MTSFASRAAMRAAVFAACACCAWTQTRLVNLSITALDKSGQPVTDLKPSDLQVADDGKQQSLVLFRLNEPQHAAAVPPHEYSNRTAETPSGAIIMVYDLLNGTFTDREYITISIVKALARLENPGNVFLYFITNKGEFYPIHPLPSSADAAKLDRNWTTQSKAMIDDAVQHVYGLRPMDARDPAVRSVAAYKLLEDLSVAASALPGRKTMVWITDGPPIAVNYGGSCHDVTVMGVTSRCIGEYVDFTPLVRKVASDVDHNGLTISPVEAYGVSVQTREVLEDIATETAGKVYVTASLNDAIATAVQTGRANYSVAFQPANWDGKYHKLKVTCARKGVQILAEQGYLAAAPVDETAKLVQSAAFAPMDLAGIGLRASYSAGRVTLKIDANTLQLPKIDGHYTGDLAMVFLAISDKGPATIGKPNALSLSLTDQQYETAMRDGIPLSQPLTVPAGVKQIRIVVADRAAGTVGSLTLPAQ